MIGRIRSSNWTLTLEKESQLFPDDRIPRESLKEKASMFSWTYFPPSFLAMSEVVTMTANGTQIKAFISLLHSSRLFLKQHPKYIHAGSINFVLLLTSKRISNKM
jgi:hypothetical protein